MMLAIDSGNTRTKWGVFNLAGELLHEGVFVNAQTEFSVPSAWLNCERAMIANVAGEAQAERVSAWLKASNLKGVFLQATEQACGVSNGYTKPAQLGIDRWAALIGAWSLYQQACVVVNAGTAVTVDVLTPKEHGGAQFVGGLILPGMALMQKSLMSGTANLAAKALEVKQTTDKLLPNNTADAIEQGVIRAIAGAVRTVYDELCASVKYAPQCVVTGGNAADVAQGLRTFAGMDNNVAIVPHLVLRGLFELERETA